MFNGTRHHLWCEMWKLYFFRVAYQVLHVTRHALKHFKAIRAAHRINRGDALGSADRINRRATRHVPNQTSGFLMDRWHAGNNFL